MPNSFSIRWAKIPLIGRLLPRLERFGFRDPKLAVRAGLGVLLAANLVAAYFVFRPPGGSLEELDEQAVTLTRQITQRKALVERTKALVEKVSRARAEEDQFLNAHFLYRRNAYSTILSELERGARTAGIKARDHAFNYEPIEGSDTLGLLTISANYEGTYADLIQFVNQLDRSKRLLIIETLQAQPQQGAGLLQIGLKMFAFVREEGPEPPPETEELPPAKASAPPGAGAAPPAPGVAPAPPPEQPGAPRNMPGGPRRLVRPKTQPAAPEARS
jgi:hypothetical protein